LTPWPFTVAIMGLVAGRLADRHPAGILGTIGLAILAAGLLATSAKGAEPVSTQAIMALIRSKLKGPSPPPQCVMPGAMKSR